MKRGFGTAGAGEASAHEPSVSLKAVMHNPRESLFPSFASLFEDGGASDKLGLPSRGGGGGGGVDAATLRAIGIDDFGPMTSREMVGLYERFVSDLQQGKVVVHQEVMLCLVCLPLLACLLWCARA